jgi:hypothetical protein
VIRVEFQHRVVSGFSRSHHCLHHNFEDHFPCKSSDVIGPESRASPDVVPCAGAFQKRFP